MIPTRHLPNELLTLAHRQAGVASREQLLAFGITDKVIQRMLHDGRLCRICRSVYAIHDGGWLQLAWAGVLIGGSSAVLGGSSAAFLHGLVKEPPSQVLVFSTNWRSPDDRWRLVRSPRTGGGEPPRTRLAQTVVDLTADLDADSIVSVVAEAIGRHRVRPSELRQVLGETARHPNRALLEDLITEVADGSRSPLEARYVRDVERAHGLPRAIRQQSPLTGYASDAWYRDYRLVVELDGRAFHSGRAALDDMDRDNDHQLVGVTTLRFGWRQVTGTPCKVAAKVARALRLRGWPDHPHPCRRCRAPF